jgi:long-subunit acyl-CoA synthetase (AMP-forming)
VRAALGRGFTILRAGERAAATTTRGVDVVPLRPACARVDASAVLTRLTHRQVDIMAPATVMFTSGSTGQPKGIVFNLFNLVSKRFARAAALPAVGRDEVLLCYLPLFHTFGRYFEMLGTIYWGGTYVFAGSPTAEGLLAELARVRPTGLISVPVRWTQIREQCLERMERDDEGADEDRAFREVVGDRLRWGLSAAGYLDPLVFRFFQRHGVDLCSGFGMTEATGGITMTPPGSYVDGTVGIPLPGMRIRFGDTRNCRLPGRVAIYSTNTARSARCPTSTPTPILIGTGDLQEHEGGYLIVDRIKDIYKNSCTVALQRVEQRFASVPGIT